MNVQGSLGILTDTYVTISHIFTGPAMYEAALHSLQKKSSYYNSFMVSYIYKQLAIAILMGSYAYAYLVTYIAS